MILGLLLVTWSGATINSYFGIQPNILNYDEYHKHKKIVVKTGGAKRTVIIVPQVEVDR